MQAESQVFLDHLDLNVTGPIVVMVCRKWDVNAVSGRYLSTDFLISDARVSCKFPFPGRGLIRVMYDSSIGMVAFLNVFCFVQGNTMHCTAKAKISHSFVTKLVEGNIYTILDFAVIPNTEEYRIMKKSAYIIEFHGGTTVRRSLVKSDGFVRHPFNFIDFDDLQVTDNKYLIGNIQC